MTYGTENGIALRAALVELNGEFQSKDWEDHCAAKFKHVWFTDCQSLYDDLKDPVAQGCEDKRLEIDLGALREHLWFTWLGHHSG